MVWVRSLRRRHRVVLTVVGLTVALGAPLASSGEAKQTKHCRSGQVRRTIKYVHRAGGPVEHATGCVVTKVLVPKSFAAIQEKVRALALTFVPADVRAAFLGKAARLVATTDAKSDAALGADVKAHASRLAANRDFRTSAVAVMHAGYGSAVTAASGTQTLYLHRYTNLDTADDTGESFVSGSTAKSTRITGASSSKTLTVTHLINKCPDAVGIAHGTLDYALRDLRVDGPRTITETSKLQAQILAHFDDTAHIASVEVIGTWSFTVSTRHTNRSVGGGVSASNFRQTAGSNYLDLPTTVTTGTDDNIVTGGGPLGVWAAEALAHEYIEQMLNKIPQGVCVNIVPDSSTVHVAPGGTVAIVAHLTDHHGQTFPGAITEYNGLDRVSPTKADGTPDATFTYAAPRGATAGSTDVVQLSHISKRGKGIGGTVTVIIDKDPYPARFSGSWTSVFTTPNGSQGWKETVHGTATYVRDPASPHLEAGQSYVHYTVQSVGVDWTVSGSGNPSGQCTITFSGSGTAQATTDSPVASQLTLEDVRNNPYGPSSEAQPYYYSIAASGDGANPPPYSITHTPTGCGIDSQGATSVNYLGIGWPDNYGPNAPPGQIEKTANPSQLQGHYVGPSNTGLEQVDTTWSFTGSG